MIEYHEIEQQEPSGELGTIVQIPSDKHEVAMRLTRNYIRHLADQAMTLAQWSAECRRLGFADIADSAMPMLRMLDETQARAVALLRMLDGVVVQP